MFKKDWFVNLTHGNMGRFIGWLIPHTLRGGGRCGGFMVAQVLMEGTGVGNRLRYLRCHLGLGRARVFGKQIGKGMVYLQESFGGVMWWWVWCGLYQRWLCYGEILVCSSFAGVLLRAK